MVQLSLDSNDMSKEETIDLLNELIHVCKDGEHGYRTAAEDVRNSQLQSVFGEYAKQRSSCARQLQAKVERLGGDATDSGTLTVVLMVTVVKVGCCKKIWKIFSGGPDT